MKIIGRIREKDILSSCLSSKRPEFVVVYGRRRVGKTFLSKNFLIVSFLFMRLAFHMKKPKAN